MKIFIANSWFSYICRIFIYFPLIASIVFSYTEKNNVLVGGLIGSYLLYIMNSLGLGNLIFKKDYLFTPSDLVPWLFRFQYKEKIYYKDIFSILYRRSIGNSKGKGIGIQKMIYYLEIMTNDSHVHKIAIDKYSRKQRKKIENEIVKRNPEVLVLNEDVRWRN